VIIPSPEPGLWKEITGTVAKLVDVFIKPLRVVSDAVAIRTEILLRRKPRVYVNFQFVLIDQWKRRYRTEEREFMWVGPRKDVPKASAKD
jgi:hypothetical protein